MQQLPDDDPPSIKQAAVGGSRSAAHADRSHRMNEPMDKVRRVVAGAGSWLGCRELVGRDHPGVSAQVVSERREGT